MRLVPNLTSAAILDQLTREAEAAWGAARLPAQEPTLAAAAAALYELARRPLDLRDDEPDFIGEAE